MRHRASRRGRTRRCERSLRVPPLPRQPSDRRLNASRSMWDAHSFQRHFDHTERAKDHRRVNVPHAGDAERLARQLADAMAEHHPAILPTPGAHRVGVTTGAVSSLQRSQLTGFHRGSSLASEAFGTLDTVVGNLCRVSAQLSQRHHPALTNAWCASYPVWLQRFLEPSRH
jgi:hypothetical protein